MHLRISARYSAAACLALALFPPALAQPAPAGKTARQAFKNIQVLVDAPADQLQPAMQLIAASLGVECQFCHVEGKMDSDDKPAKKTARRMIAMTLALNKDNFNSRKEVTCYTCHRGNHDPMGTPPVAASDAGPEHVGEAEAAAGPMPKADQILAKYVAALGGAEALHKISSRVEKGKIVFGGHTSPIEVYAKAPDKRMSITHMGNGESITAFDGHSGWLGNTGRPAHDMTGQEVDAARIDADFYFATQLKEIFTGFGVWRPEQIDGRPVYVVSGTRPGLPPVRLYFDQSSGLLLRLVRYTDTPVGRSPTQIDYADYREVDGVKVPFRWTLARVNGRFTIQIEEAQQNVPIDDGRFAKPVTP